MTDNQVNQTFKELTAEVSKFNCDKVDKLIMELMPRADYYKLNDSQKNYITDVWAAVQFFKRI